MSQQVGYSHQSLPMTHRVSSKTRGIAVLLALFFGGLGIHRFYLNRPGTGVLYLIFCWTFIPAIVALVEVVLFLMMSDRQFDQNYNMALA